MSRSVQLTSELRIAVEVAALQYGNEQPQYLRNRPSDAQNWNTALSNHKRLLPKEEADEIECLFIQALKDRLLPMAASSNPNRVAEFERIKVGLNDCPLSDENKQDIKLCIAYCEKNAERYRAIDEEVQAISFAVNRLREEDQYSIQARFFENHARKLENAMKTLVKNPEETLPLLPSFVTLKEAYASAKGDLDFCSAKTSSSEKTSVNKHDLLDLKLDAALKEADLARSQKLPSTPSAELQMKRLDVLEAKIKYEMTVYQARSETGRKYSGLLVTSHGTGSSADEKLGEAKKMLEVVGHLKHNLSHPDDPKSVSWSAGKAANDDGHFRYASTLTKLYNEVVRLGGDDTTPREKTRFSFNRT